ncbi:MAG: hypothetical protein ACRC7O_08005 [Fimbriiglobus sp.]
MVLSRLLLISGAISFAFIAMSASAAKADLIVTFTGVTPAHTASLTLGSPLVGPGTYAAGVMNYTVATPNGGSHASHFGATIRSFCVELTEFPPVGEHTYAVESPGTLAQAVDATTVRSRLEELWGKYSGLTGTGEGAAAFQIAAWETVYDTTFDVTSGNFQSFGSNPTLSSFVLNGDKSLWNANFAGKQLVVLTSPAAQDQLALADGTVYGFGGGGVGGNPVPAPAGVWLGLIGVAALVGRSRVVGNAA